MRAFCILLIWAVPAHADPCLPKEVADTRDKLPATFEVNDDEPDLAKAVAKCRHCGALRELLADKPTAAVDRTGKLAFVIEDGYPAHGSTWSLVTGKRVARFAIKDFEGPPPPTNFNHVEIVGRHAFVGEPGEPYAVTFDLYTGDMDMLFEHAKLGHGLVVENDGMGRLDLVDYTQAKHPRVAVRRVRARLRGSEPDGTTLLMKTVTLGEQTVVVVEDPPLTVLVDTRKRTISKPRALPRCR